MFLVGGVDSKNSIHVDFVDEGILCVLDEILLPKQISIFGVNVYIVVLKERFHHSIGVSTGLIQVTRTFEVGPCRSIAFIMAHIYTCHLAIKTYFTIM